MIEKKYDHQTQQARIKKMWHDNATYQLTDNDLKTRPLFSIDTPPPTVSGSLHIGHIFSYTHTDFIARFKRMSGYSIFYPFGYDGNGLPTERFVEKSCGVTALSMGRSTFISLCLKEMEVVERKFRDLFETMALSIDWRHTYSTIDDATRRLSQKSFIQLLSKGFVYRKKEPALYCTSCFTSVAQAELEDAEKETLFTTLLFTSNDGKPLPIATTRPEFLGGCVALFYHPNDHRYTHLKGTYATIPLYGTQVPIMEEESIIPEKGTGLVMCCAFGDTSDIQWIEKHALPYQQILQRDGRFVETLPFVGGLKVKQARQAVLDELQKRALILQQKPMVHTVNIHERCNQDIEFLPLAQWFIDIKSYKEEFLTLGAQISWYPLSMKSRYDNWVEHLNWDWCISRQRFFGIPFPCWHCTNCHEIIMADEALLPIDPQETPYGKPCPSCLQLTVAADTDVMDTWNTSSLTPFILQLIYQKSYPSSRQLLVPLSIRPQAHDIIRTWAFDTIVKSWMHTGDIPWRNIVISGHVLSTEKQKLSKSQGNSPLAPTELLKTYPVDAIRYWAAGAQLGVDTLFSENQLKIGQRLMVKLWNASLFSAEHGAKTDCLKPIDTLNQWIVHQAQETFARYTHFFNEYSFNKALESIERFFWNDWCDNYIELIKDRFFHPEQYTAQEIEETRGVLYMIGYELLQWYAPFLPYITDNLYQDVYKVEYMHESIHRTDYQSAEHHYTYPDTIPTITLLLAAVQQVRKLKTDAQRSLKTDIRNATLSSSSATMVRFKQVEKLFAGVARTACIIYTNEPVNTKLTEDNGVYSLTLDLEALNR